MKRNIILYVSLLALATSLNGYATVKNSGEIHKLVFDNWVIHYNCDHRGYEFFYYTAGTDTGNLERYKPFHQENQLPKYCRQKSTSTYKLPKNFPLSYDRGHGVHQNIWDHSRELMKQSNSMANIVPQASKLNRRGAWRQTEKLTECWRDKGDVAVHGGVIWGSDKSNDHFKSSHGVTTPDYLYKIIQFHDGGVNAWIFPNNNEPTVENIDNYLVSPADITELTGIIYNIPIIKVNVAAKTTRDLPVGCSLK
ncbi:DNA/RNA non-specific endonuclease [Porticoccaceae bacterium]|nr:DNA/RNA non-specific endonuclease [Porticoccaceae bacterium]